MHFLKIHFKFLLLSFLLCNCIWCEVQSNDDLWNELKPYFLPSTHPLKAKLDALFRKDEGIFFSSETLRNAGFIFKERKPHQIILVRHPKLPGYLIKAYLDSQPIEKEWVGWVKRIKGSKVIKRYIEKHQLKGFKVPNKWIYPLPENTVSRSGPGIYPKRFILVVDDMMIMNHKSNSKAYKRQFTKPRLFDLFLILKEVGHGNLWIGNIPFNYKNELCFIDTEHYHFETVEYERLTNKFSPQMQVYWQQLIDQERQ